MLSPRLMAFRNVRRVVGHYLGLGEIPPASNKLVEAGTALRFAEGNGVPEHPPRYCGDDQIHEVLWKRRKLKPTKQKQAREGKAPGGYRQRFFFVTKG